MKYSLGGFLLKHLVVVTVIFIKTVVCIWRWVLLIFGGNVVVGLIILLYWMNKLICIGLYFNFLDEKFYITGPPWLLSLCDIKNVK